MVKVILDLDPPAAMRYTEIKLQKIIKEKYGDSRRTEIDYLGLEPNKQVGYMKRITLGVKSDRNDPKKEYILVISENGKNY